MEDKKIKTTHGVLVQEQSKDLIITKVGNSTVIQTAKKITVSKA